MKKSKILLGTLSLTALTPAMAMITTSCANNDKAFTPKVEKDEHVKNVTLSPTELNRAFSASCAFVDGYEIDATNTKVTVGNKVLVNDVDYIVYYNIVIVASAAVTDKNVIIDVKSKEIDATTYTVALYANDGKFSDGSKTLPIKVKKGTKLCDAEGYQKPTVENETWIKWVDSEGKDFDENKVITENQLLGAVYKETAAETKHDLSLDNWATVAVQCATMSTFVKAYLDNSFAGTEEEAKTIILNAIEAYAKGAEGAIPLEKTMKINLGAISSVVTVRLIDVAHDQASSSEVTKPMFTWEFADSIDVCNYSWEGKSVWYQEDSETHEVLHSALLRENCNNLLFTKLPQSIQEAIVPVTKKTRVSEGVEDNYISSEWLFPLSYGEIGLQASNQQINDLTEQGQYKYYNSLVGESAAKAVKYYLGYDGTKEYTKDFTPILQYPMWMRSPANNPDVGGQVYMFNPDNIKLYTVYTNSGCSVAPAFCL